MARAGSRELAVIRAAFSDYYEKSASLIEAPGSVAQREFGFLVFPEKMMVRHKTFQEAREVHDFIKHNVPSDCYYSVAYYNEPGRDMDLKGWLGADLVFDIDADHLVTDCKRLHDRWSCQACKSTGQGGTPETCPRCGSQRFKEETWFCERCLDAAKKETLKLMDLLVADLGLSSTEIRVYFSGHRGYHIHVEAHYLRELDQLARKEIVDYVSGTGLSLQYHDLIQTSPSRTAPKVLDQDGWGARLLRAVSIFIQGSTEESLLKTGVRIDTSRRLLSEKRSFIDGLMRGVGGQSIRGLGQETWLNILRAVLREQTVHVDSVVTTDVHRLIRMTGTLHGKTGLRKTPADVDGLESFDPLVESVSLKGGHLKVHVQNAYEFRLGEETYGPFKDLTVELPKAAGLLLLLKGAATIAQENTIECTKNS